MNRTRSLAAAGVVALAAAIVVGWFWFLPNARPLLAAPVRQEQPGPRIVGGQEAPVGAYPWMTALVQNNLSPSAGQFCGGALIHREWVMTAAHCVTNGSVVDAPSSIDIVVGLHRLSLNNGIRRDLQTILVHPNWNSSNYDYDIALLRLASPIDDVAPVAIVQPSDAPLFEPGDIVRVMGWGATAWQGSSSDVLLQVDVPVVAQQTCRDSYGATSITDRMLCAGLAEGGKDSCQGDSGGPLVANDNGAWKEVGIVSWGNQCAAPNLYGVYARVAVLYEWVMQQIDPAATATPTATSSPTPTVTPTVTGTPPTATPTPTATATFLARAFLPQIMRQNPPTPTPTPTAIPLVNADFEQGPGAGWQEYSLLGYDLIVNDFGDNAITPHSGQWAAWLGGDDNEISYVRQTVSIPTGASILSFWAWIGSEDSCGFDFGGVMVNATVADQFDLCEEASTGGWVRRTVNLGAYTGQNVALQIRAETDSSLNSNLFVDDVALTNAAGTVYQPALLDSGAGVETSTKSAAGMVRRAPVAAPESRLLAPSKTAK